MARKAVIDRRITTGLQVLIIIAGLSMIASIIHEAYKGYQANAEEQRRPLAVGDYVEVQKGGMAKDAWRIQVNPDGPPILIPAASTCEPQASVEILAFRGEEAVVQMSKSARRDDLRLNACQRDWIVTVPRGSLQRPKPPKRQSSIIE